MRFQIANRNQVLLTLILSCLLGWTLSYGFIPLSQRLLDGLLESLKSLSFPILALIFFISLPDSRCIVPAPFSRGRLLTLCVLPLVIAFIFGLTKSFPTGFSSFHFFPWNQVMWAWVIVPLGEELLFRGWVTSLLNRLCKNVFLGTPPLFPLSLWGSAIAFSFWHLQNSSSVPLSSLSFQIFYTFFVGIWLGFLKWQSGKIWPCILAHGLLNFSADCQVWFMLK